MAYELGLSGGNQEAIKGKGGKIERGERGRVEVVAFDGITELHGATEAGGGDGRHGWDVCFV